jgi:A/G-specific adenine glycosylase
MNQIKLFRAAILKWYSAHQRELPWRNTNDPYRIWLSEIIMQQTRIAQGLPYYLKFLSAYPNVHSLARAKEDDVLKLWQGLGYYSRARNMLHTARKISVDYEGQFPSELKQLLKLKGIGNYTARAILSFAFKKPEAVLDGNVLRVISRYLNISIPINEAGALKHYQQLADDLLDKQHSDTYNQAIMDFGSMQCTASNPNCAICPLLDRCEAQRDHTVADLPVKLKNNPKRIRHLNYLFIHNQTSLLLQKRTGKDIWKNLYEFPLFESHQELVAWDEIMRSNLLQETFSIDALTQLKLIGDVSRVKHQLTHQSLIVKIWPIECSQIPVCSTKSNIFEARMESLEKAYALPIVLHRYIESIK